MPTASSVVADLVNVAMGITALAFKQLGATPADIVYTENSPALEYLQSKGLLAPVDSATLAHTPSKYNSPQGDWLGVRRGSQADPRAIRSCERNLAINAFISNGFGGVLHKVKEYLDQLIAGSKHIGERGIIGLDKADVAAKPGLGQALHMIEDRVDIEAFPL